MSGEPGFRLSVAPAEEGHVDAFEVCFGHKGKKGVPQQVGMYIGHQFTGLAGALHECDLHFGVKKQNAQQFSCGIASAADDACPNHGVPVAD